MAWRVAKSLEKFRAQVNTLYPDRRKVNDGTIGDAKHASRSSDHNPWIRDGKSGVVSALDITHDPKSGVDTHAMYEVLRQKRDPRIKYVISNRRIFNSKDWTNRRYNGSNAHSQHIHISVQPQKALYDDIRDWDLGQPMQPKPPPSPTIQQMQRDIVATVFGGKKDPNRSAYDNHLINDQEYGVALPFRFVGDDRAQVLVINPANDKSVICEIVDVGPWNINDAYWLTGERPQAESGKDASGRKTNGAGIDVTPAVDRLLELKGKAKVHWAFIGDSEDVA
jgi:hypothetical protein